MHQVTLWCHQGLILWEPQSFHNLRIAPGFLSHSCRHRLTQHRRSQPAPSSGAMATLTLKSIPGFFTNLIFNVKLQPFKDQTSNWLKQNKKTCIPSRLSAKQELLRDDMWKLKLWVYLCRQRSNGKLCICFWVKVAVCASLLWYPDEEL